MERVETTSTVVLWDIDGTLIDSCGAGGSSLLQALEHEFQLSGARGVTLRGRTDAGIFRELLQSNGVGSGEAEVARLSRRYAEFLPNGLAGRQGRLLPGVRALLDMMQAETRFRMGLLTGNMPFAAQLKLKHYGLDHYFTAGTFGDQARERAGLKVHALATASQLNGGPIAPQRILVIGDTPLDIELAQAMGARCLAVGTGGYATDELLAAGADRVEGDLSNTLEIFNWCIS